LVFIATLACTPPVAGQAESVKPGVNASYLDLNLQVTEWVERFEHEGREVFDLRHQIVSAIGLKPGMAVADIGTGTGLFLPLLAEQVGPGGRVYAVDIVPQFLEHIDEVAKTNEWSTVETVLCTERSIELPKNSLDVAYLCDVYHHFEYPEDSLESIRQALKPGGQLFIVDFKRIPGVSDDWILEHVRAGQELVEQEIVRAAFRKITEIADLLPNNFVLKFEKE